MTKFGNKIALFWTFKVLRNRDTIKKNRKFSIINRDCHKEHTDSLDLKEVANDFVSGSDHHIHFFGTFL